MKYSSESSFSLVEMLQNICFYPVHIFRDNALVYPETPAEDSDPFFCDPDLFGALSASQGIVYEGDNHEIFFSVGKQSPYILIAGPFCFQSLSQSNLRLFARAHHVKNAFSLRIPRASFQQALDTIALAGSLLTCETSLPASDDVDTAAVSPWFFAHSEEANSPLKEETLSEEEKQYQIQLSQFHAAEQDIPHTPYEMEMQILKAMQASDKEQFYHLLESFSNYSAGNFASTSGKFKEYSAVSMITILTRAAIEGGVSPGDAYALSDALLLKTSTCRDENTYLEIFQEALESFFQLVKRSNEAENSSIYIRNCKAYISQHLNKDLSPELIAEHLGISKNYLLRLFPQYEHITLMQYILRERVFAAANMLKYSDYDIMRIASYFHFQTQSHFGVVFKKYLGMSPAAYRKKHKPVGF